MSKDYLLFDAISAQGPVIDHVLTSAGDSSLCFQLHVLFQNKISRSQYIAHNHESHVIFDFPVTYTGQFDHIAIKDSQICVLLSYFTQSDKKVIGTNNYEQTIVAQAVIDFALLSLYSGAFLSVDLLPCQSDYINTGEQSVGVLFIKVPDIIGNLTEAEQDMTRSLIAQKHALISAKSRQVFHLVKAFWSRLQSEYVHLSQRSLRFMVEDECGRLRYVGSYIFPMACQREIEGPRFAARFVSLIPYHKVIGLTGGRLIRWQSAFTTLSTLRGDVEDHCILLCNLLLGWGLNAFVALGSIHNSSELKIQDADQTQYSHAWVVTFDDDHSITYWESLTGEQITFRRDCPAIESPLQNTHFKDVFSLFRFDDYYVNIQNVCDGIHTKWDITNPRMWQRFSVPSDAVDVTSHIGSHCVLEDSIHDKHSGLPPLIPLNAASLSGSRTYQIEELLESQLKQLITDLRSERGLQSHFDESISRILHATLASYELERATGVTFGMKDFQTAAKRLVRKNETFKAYPTCFNHCDITRIFTALQSTKAARDIMFAYSRLDITNDGQDSKNLVFSSGPPARLGLRVRVFEYPRHIAAVWVILAVCSQANDK